MKKTIPLDNGEELYIYKHVFPNVIRIHHLLPNPEYPKLSFLKRYGEYTCMKDEVDNVVEWFLANGFMPKIEWYPEYQQKLRPTHQNPNYMWTTRAHDYFHKMMEKRKALRQ